MYVFDRIVPHNIIDSIIKLKATNLDNELWKFARTDNADDYYWTQFIYGNNYSVSANLNHSKTEFAVPEVKALWDWFSNVTNISIDNLDSCYINGLSYGVESFAHVDFYPNETGCTCIFYINPEWHSQWGGETVFYDGEFVDNFLDDWYYQHDIVKCVLPRYNRLLVFDGTIAHSVRPLSKTFKGLRQTLMFKLRNIHVEYLKEYLCKYNKGHIAPYSKKNVLD